MNQSEPIRGCIDRFEERFALVELPDHAILRSPRTQLPPNVCPGDWLFLDRHGCWQIDPAATQAAQLRISQLIDELFE